MAERPKITTADDSLIVWSGLALNDLAKDAIFRRAEADEKIAESTTATPARQESVRVGIVVVGILAIAAGSLLGIDKEIIHAAIYAVGGIYVLPAALGKLRGAMGVSVARHMGPAVDVFARDMGPPNRQGHGARAAGDRTLDRQGHGASRSPGTWGHPVS